MADDSEFDFVTASVRRAVRLQRDYAKAFLEAAGASPPSIGEQFVELCDEINRIVDSYQERHTTSSDEVDRKLVLNAVRELLAWTRNLQLRRPWLDAAAAPPIDLGSFYYLCGLARAIVRDDSKLTVVATHEGSYATVVNPFRVPAQPVPHGIVLVALVPHRETRSGLLHPLLAHEIGHGVANVHNCTEQLCTAVTPGPVEAALDEGARGTSGQSGHSEQEERAVLDKRLAAWIEEIFCDAIATACLGATYLFSFATEVLPDDLDTAGPKHPPTRQRVRLIVEHLDRLGWGAIIDREVPSFMKWVRAVASAPPRQQRPNDEALRTAIDLSGGKIQATADGHLGTRVLTPDEPALTAVLDLLQQHVPPAQDESGSAIDRPTIMVGCWLAALKSRGGSIDALADAVDSAELGELLPYALELSVLVGRWQTA